MNFTKEYIELCKDKRIQELRPQLEWNDFYCLIELEDEIICFRYDHIGDREDEVWLPTGDQLDEEIIKICKEKEYEYRIDCGFTNSFDTSCEVYNFEEKKIEIELWDTNPLIAKILLLLQLLEQK